MAALLIDHSAGRKSPEHPHEPMQLALGMMKSASTCPTIVTRINGFITIF